MTWQSENFKGRWGELEEFYQLEEKNMTSKFHNWKMLLGLLIVFVIGGINAIHSLNLGDGLVTILPVLVALEHVLYGNTQ